MYVNNNPVKTNDEDDSRNEDSDNLNDSTTHSNNADKSSDSHAEDALSDLHNLLYFQGPNIPTDNAGDNTEEDGNDNLDDPEDQLEDNTPEGKGDEDDSSPDSLPEEYHYLHTLNYNQPIQPRCSEIITKYQ